MAPPTLPPLPASLKSIQHYLKTACDYDTRDPSIAYWCRLYSLQQGLSLDKKSKEAIGVLTTLMTWLETTKTELKHLENVSQEMVAQAHVENQALKLFYWADGEDRALRYNKNVVKAFYSAGMLLDVCSTFGELGEDLAQQKKYAKWRAAHLHNCLKSGETPQAPAPKPDEQDLDDQTEEDQLNDEPTASFSGQCNITEPELVQQPQPQPRPRAPPAVPAAAVSYDDVPSSSTSAAALSPEQMAQAQKLCKYASSALTYDDVPTAIDNLQKALHLLQTGVAK